MERLTIKRNKPSVNSQYEKKDKVWTADCIEKLGKYEEAEEQGLLLRLTCKVGDTVWYIDDDDDDYPLELLVTKIEVEENDYLRYHAREKDNCGKIGFIKDDIGKTVFLTKEEAEQALAEMKEV